MSVFSFHPVKHITTGEGGIITTNSKELYESLLLLRSHGITRNPEMMSRYDGPWYYEMITLGYNYRITDFQCALGLSQLKKIDEFVEIKNKNIAVAIILAVLILSLTIMIDHSITSILNGLIKTPELPKDGGLIKLQPK